MISNGSRELKKRNGSTSTLVIARFVVVLYFVVTFDICNTFRYNAHGDNWQMNTFYGVSAREGGVPIKYHLIMWLYLEIKT